MFNKLLAGLLIYVMAISQVVAQTAALVPNAKQTFLGTTGAPLAAGTVTMYVPNSTTKKTTWVDPNQVSANTNPIVLDAAGRGVIFGQGNYRQVVKDKNGVQIWDSFTSSPGASAPSGATGTDTAPVGSIVAYSGFSLPTNWQLTYGQAVSRTTFSDLKAVLTIVDTTVSCINSNVTLTGFVSTAQFRVGAPIEASCIGTGVTIASIVSPTSITVSSAASATAIVTSTVYPWGNGDGTSTFNVPDLRGKTIIGPNAMGGVAASALQTTTTISTTSGSPTATVASSSKIYPGMVVSSTNVPANATVSNIVGTTVTLSANASATASGTAATFLAFINANAPASSGGLQSQAIAQTNLPSVNFVNSGITLTNGTPTISALTTTIGGVAGNASLQATNASPTGALSDPGGTLATNVTVATQGVSTSGGHGNELSILQPSTTINYMIKMAPNSTGAGGVVSLGGMFGDIICDSTLSCPPVGLENTIGCTSATSSQYGCVRPDGTTIVVGLTGNLTAIGGAATEITNGVTIIGSGTPGDILYNNGGTLGQIGIGSGLNVVGGALATVAGIQTNTLNSVTSNYSIAPSDCGKTVQAGTGSTGQFTITLPAISGFAATCSLTVVNGDAGRGKILSGFPSNVVNSKLYPLQSFDVKIVNGIWVVPTPPGRWRLSNNITFYVSASGNDANDGLASGANAYLTMQAAVTAVCTNLDVNLKQVIVQVANGTWTVPIQLCDVVGVDNGNWPLPSIAVQGDFVTPANVAFTSSGNCFTAVNVHTSWMVRGFTFTCSGASILSDYGSTIYVGNNIFSTGNIHTQAVNVGSRIEFTTGYKIQGSANVHWYATQGAQIITQPATIDLTTGPAFSGAFALATNNGIMFVNGMTFSGAGTVTGARCIIDTAGGINTGSGSSTYLPGSSGCTATTPGWYQ